MQRARFPVEQPIIALTSFDHSHSIRPRWGARHRVGQAQRTGREGGGCCMPCVAGGDRAAKLVAPGAGHARLDTGP